MSEETFYVHRDGETIEYWDPVVSTVQGSTAEERRTSTGRLGKDRKEFKLVQKLNKQNRISLFNVFSCTTTECSDQVSQTGTQAIEQRLSHLGARYPNVPGLGIYVSGLSKLEQTTEKLSNGKTKRIGSQSGKKIFDLLFYISSLQEVSCFWKFQILNKIGKLVLSNNSQGKWMQNSTTILVLLGKNEVAYTFGELILQNKSAIKTSLENGKRLSKQIFVQFYENTRPYNPKVRRRGYARSSPVRPGSSKAAIQEANTSLEYLTESGTLKSLEGGGYEMSDQGFDAEEILLKIFTNSLETFEFLQRERMEQIGIRKPVDQESPPEGEKDLTELEDPTTQLKKGSKLDE